jgi:hypothetical protein
MILLRNGPGPQLCAIMHMDAQSDLRQSEKFIVLGDAWPGWPCAIVSRCAHYHMLGGGAERGAVGSLTIAYARRLSSSSVGPLRRWPGRGHFPELPKTSHFGRKSRRFVGVVGGGCYFSTRSRPFMYGRRTSGTVTLPSAFWYVSRIAISTRGQAMAVLFSV